MACGKQLATLHVGESYGGELPLVHVFGEAALSPLELVMTAAKRSIYKHSATGKYSPVLQRALSAPVPTKGCQAGSLLVVLPVAGKDVFIRVGF